MFIKMTLSMDCAKRSKASATARIVNLLQRHNVKAESYNPFNRDRIQRRPKRASTSKIQRATSRT